LTTLFFGTTGGCLDAFYLFKELYPDDYDIAFLSDNHDINEKVCGVKIVGGFNSIKKLKFKNYNFVYQCGSSINHINRNIWFELAVKNGMKPLKLISRFAYIHETAILGYGSIIYPGVKIMANVKIGSNCIVLPNTVINHDSSIGDYSIINSSCVINGNVNIGSKSFIGSMTSIKERINIISKTTIGMSSVVLSDIQESGVYYGSPIVKSQTNKS
tara:strand:+ start:1583 stop:2227 length:645 start_codon:yes stop_codon:yes gene_type:complete